MSYTYSINPFSTDFSETRDTIDEVLSLLPDNTSKEITPKSVRDAVFSTWESSVIRYTSDGTTEYIGIDRYNVKDKKIFLGKKQISGLNIMSTSLLSSDTDIFLYNTKSDADSAQSFKMSFLSGTVSALWIDAPYLSSVYISGSQSYLSMGMINPGTYGVVSIQSGSSASISLNTLLWPSTSQISNMISSPSASTSNDLFLAVRSGGNIELLTYQSSGNSLGSPGSTTSIYGSPVLLNGNSLEYTNLSPTIATFGGIISGSTFSNVSIYNMITSMLYPYLGPLSNITITTTLNFNNSLERNHTSGYNINYSYTLTKRTNNIIQNDLIVVNGDNISVVNTSGSTVSGIGLHTQTFTSSATILSTDISSVVGKNVFTFSSIPNDGTQSFTASTGIEFVYPYFYGFYSVSSSNNATINGFLSSLSKRIDIEMDQELALSGTGYLYFCYPSIYGTLSSIQDGNGYVEYTHTSMGIWTYSSNTLASPSSYWSNGSYYVYRKTLVSTIPPSQNYKFNF